MCGALSESFERRVAHVGILVFFLFTAHVANTDHKERRGDAVGGSGNVADCLLDPSSHEQALTWEPGLLGGPRFQGGELAVIKARRKPSDVSSASQ